MKVYIATRLESSQQQSSQQYKELATYLRELDHTITYDWTVHDSVKNEGVQRLTEVADLESKGVAEADVVIALLPGGRGTHCEVGMGIALGKRVVLYAAVAEDFFSANERTCAFYHHRLVTIVSGPWDVETLHAITHAALRAQDKGAGPGPASPRLTNTPWGKFRRGDALTDAELHGLIEQAVWGERFLEDRGETGGVLRSLRSDLHTLRSFEQARGR